MICVTPKAFSVVRAMILRKKKKKIRRGRRKEESAASRLLIPCHLAKPLPWYIYNRMTRASIQYMESTIFLVYHRVHL